MKIVIFTPVNRTSAIGRVGSLLVRKLKQMGEDVSVVRTELNKSQHDSVHEFGVELISWERSDQVKSRCDQADLIIYQIGDNFEYHSGCVVWLPQYPGVVCLHDFFLGHLFWGWAQGNGDEAKSLLRVWYGEEMAARYFNFQDSESFIEGTRHSAPLTEWICSMAAGVVTHSAWGIDRVLKSCPGPVHIAPLAFEALRREDPDLFDCGDDDSFNILTVGHVNANKRAAQVIQAIGNSALLNQRAVYELVGKVQPAVERSLSALALELNVNLVVSGEVDDLALSRALSKADVVSCLRWPSLEAASASAIEAMLNGKAVLVISTGFYQELPDSVVTKIDPVNEVANIQAALEYLASDQKYRSELGARAAAWARETFSIENYAERILEIGKCASCAEPKLAAVNQFVQWMQSWGASEDLMTLGETFEPLEIFERTKSRDNPDAVSLRQSAKKAAEFPEVQ